ncbi:MAG: hypothetical protein C4345_13595, partial [Chloroflexota bacterium]
MAGHPFGTDNFGRDLYARTLYGARISLTAGFGVAVLNDGKYGHGVFRNEMTLSLVRGPIYPDPFADEGHHWFTYSLLPHTGDWVQAGVVFEAFALNSPLIAVPGVVDAGRIPASWGLIETGG